MAQNREEKGVEKIVHNLMYVLFHLSHFFSRKWHLRKVPLVQGYFCAVYHDYAGKADLSKDCWNPKRTLGVAMHF